MRGGKLDEKALLTGCLQDDDAAWQALAALIARFAAFFASQYSLSSESASDIAQTALLTIRQQDLLRRFEGRSSLRAYLAGIVRNTARAYSRRHVNVSPLTNPIPKTERLYGEIETMEMLGHLSSRDALLVQLDTAGYTAEEIADVLTRLDGKPIRPATVRKRLERARRTLRSQLRSDEERDP